MTVLEVGADVTPRQVAPAQLPGWLNIDPHQKLFQLAGPADAVTCLVEQYHPDVVVTSRERRPHRTGERRRHA